MSGDALPGAPKPTSLSRRTVEDLIFHSAALRRYTQDSPILPDVWFAYGLNPDARIDLLLTPARSDDPNPPGRIADQLARAIERDSKRRQEPPGVLDERLADAKLAYTQSTAAAALTFPEMVAYLLPLCYWRVEGVQLVDKWKRIASMSPAERADLAEQLAQFEAGRPRHGTDVAPLTILWGVRLVGRIALALEGVPESRLTDTPDRARMTDDERAKDDQRRRDLAGQLVEAVAGLIDREAPDDPLVFSVSLNRHAEVSVYRSVPTVKADAARGLFPVDFKGLAWAVIDSGIDATHPAFRVRDLPRPGQTIGDLRPEPFQAPDPKDPARSVPGNSTRIIATYDFTGVRELTDPRCLEKLSRMTNRTLAKRLEADDDLVQEMKDTLRAHRPIRWTHFAELLRVKHQDPAAAAGDEAMAYRRPANEHGTHVAGILAGDWRMSDTVKGMPDPPSFDLIGVCPSLQLYDLRVFGDDGTGDEYAVLAAIEFLQGLTNEHEDLTVQGVNMSFSIRHDVANYACGRTPVCDDVKKLVSSGVVVVAAAGNDGYRRPDASAGDDGEGYQTVSISDPGNAEEAITVGSTHGYRPYAYGVSYFSSRGPTGDGRAKPDLVAPGEKIWSAVPEGRVLALDGTSMAAPHVSGCAALLMARYHELIGEPGRIKAILTSTASDLGRESYFQGHGLVDVLRAMQSI